MVILLIYFALIIIDNSSHHIINKINGKLINHDYIVIISNKFMITQFNIDTYHKNMSKCLIIHIFI